MTRFDVRAERRIWNDTIAFLIVEFRNDGRAAAKPIVFEKIDDLEYREPTFELQTEVAQKLMDELWRCGLRPTEGTGSAGALAAVERHLKDLQRLVFEKGQP